MAPERSTASALSTHDAAEGSRTEPAARGVPIAANTRHHALLAASGATSRGARGAAAVGRVAAGLSADCDAAQRARPCAPSSLTPRTAQLLGFGRRPACTCTDHSSGASRTSESRSESGLSHTSVWPRSSSNNSSSALNSKDGASLAQPPSGAELGSFRN